MNGTPTLHVVAGLPAAGKTTRASQLERDERALRLSPDEWLIALGHDGLDEAARTRVEELQWALAQRWLALGYCVVLEFGTWRVGERVAFARRAAELGARSELHALEPPLDELERRLTARNERAPATGFVVELDLLRSWAATYEPVGADDEAAFDVVRVER